MIWVKGVKDEKGPTSGHGFELITGKLWEDSCKEDRLMFVNTPCPTPHCHYTLSCSFLCMWKPEDNLGSLRSSLLVPWSSQSGLGWLASEAQGSSCLHPQRWDYNTCPRPTFSSGAGIKVRASDLLFLLGSGDQVPGPLAHKGNTVSTEPPPV